jgi:multiple sugar transport system ATP-binding protein
MNFVDGKVDGGRVVLGEDVQLEVPPSLSAALRPGDSVRIGFRPEALHPSATDTPRAARVGARLILREPLGHETLTHLRVAGAEWVARGTREFTQDPSGHTPVFLDLDRMHIFWKDSGRRVGSADEPAVARGTTEAPA